jgi:5-methylcytosine-specific restriction protein B
MADNTKYNFNGIKKLAKNRLVLEVVKKYINENSLLTYMDFKNIFKDELQGPIGVIKNEEEWNKWALNRKKGDKEVRFFSKENEIINHDEENIYVCSEWGNDTESGIIGNFPKFLKFAENELQYTIVSSNTSEIPNINSQNKKEEKTIKNNKIKNIILYGVPGVGKTYNTKKLISLLEMKQEENDIFIQIEENSLNDSKEANKLVDNIKDRVKFITFHQSFGYEDFIEGFRPNEDGNIKLQSGVFKELCEKAEDDKENKYYLVIDEINRGNISKIFGELITLIEEDKRDSLYVTLPYSKKEFSIPSNLYIIGTMNSTDKSIALIDIALRRRFTFIHMRPNPELVKYHNAKELMIKLNEKLDSEYKIGHSYFMNIKNDEDLAFVCRYKIKPLLEEYFYGDKEGLKEILDTSDHFRDVTKMVNKQRETNDRNFSNK